ncbi:MAG: DNA alkylation repair protein [Ruminococcus sp.]|uniref:DNA alkylation repair protein n=1 Tax=Ruminococcus sp. TaxID=41978 RepID=UPI001B0E3FBB|nr:DNA alkylation repair protein [Ruminococcus sp.]MBO7473852.1 DNA alkylation repair protein [Ruminococcus sp.]
MDKYTNLKTLFESRQDQENSAAMAKYMKNRFIFYGIATPERKELYKDFLKAEKASKKIDWSFLDKCYADDHREFQYLVYDYLLAMKKYLVYEDTDKIQRYIITKPWWDTTDFLCKVIGEIGLKDQRVSGLMLKWSAGSDIWLKRTAILHQLAYKDKTDIVLLEQIISNCLGSNEFFINKAIGWALREYSKTAPEWVESFISRRKNELSPLSIKEGSKYI